MAKQGENVTARPVLLCVLDGFGLREAAPDNAASVASMPVWRRLWNENARAVLEACGVAVGLPEGQIGNSEVGHMNLGAGRVVYQDLPLIDRAIESGELAKKKELAAFAQTLKESGGVCHLMGLASPGGVHSHQRHIVALAGLVASYGVPVAIHAFLDGRDVPPDSAANQIETLEKDLAAIPGAKIVTLCGRYYAMDRDARWERVEKAYKLLVFGEGEKAASPVVAIRASYARGVYDEFVLPCVLGSYEGMREGDGLLFANFRADRARQLPSALLDPSFSAFARGKTVSFAAALSMTEYADFLKPFMATLFPPKSVRNGLGQSVASAGLTQLRIAETEKYPHVTFFFNGGTEEPLPGESRIMVSSPKVATYDLRPEMSANEVTDKVVQALASGAFSFILLNYANPDMVGHTGDLDATVKALEALDVCLGRVVEALEKTGGLALITADHGNCEIMKDQKTGGPHTAHTLSKVPCVLVGARALSLRQEGKLADVAPTVLELMGLAKPAEMEGESLLVQP